MLTTRLQQKHFIVSLCYASVMKNGDQSKLKSLLLLFLNICFTFPPLQALSVELTWPYPFLYTKHVTGKRYAQGAKYGTRISSAKYQECNTHTSLGYSHKEANTFTRSGSTLVYLFVNYPLLSKWHNSVLKSFTWQEEGEGGEGRGVVFS